MRSIEVKCVAEGAVVREECELLNSIEWYGRQGRIAGTGSVPGAELQVRMHDRPRCRNHGVLAAGAHKVERPQRPRSKRNKHGAVKSEIQQAVRTLLKFSPR